MTLRDLYNRMVVPRLYRSRGAVRRALARAVRRAREKEALSRKDTG